MAMKTRYNVVNGQVLSETRNGVRRDYLTDGLGNTLALLDSTQTKTDTFDYFPSGTVAARTGTTATPFQWIGGQGYFTDSSTRKYVRARNYHNNLARWGSQDPIGFNAGDYNLYRYVNNMFVVMTDPSGLDIDCTTSSGKCALITSPNQPTKETVGCYKCIETCAYCKDGQVGWTAVYSVASNQINSKNSKGCFNVTPGPIYVLPITGIPIFYTPTVTEILDMFAKVTGCLASTESDYNVHCHGPGTSYPTIKGAWGVLQQSVDSFRVCKEPGDPSQICDLTANVNSTINMIISHATGKKKSVDRALRSEMESYHDNKTKTKDCLKSVAPDYSWDVIKGMMDMIQGVPCSGVSKKCY